MPSSPPPAWKKEFASRRESFINSLRTAVADTQVLCRVFDAESGYTNFSKWENGKLIQFNQGTLADAESFLRYLIDQGHKVAFAVSREGPISSVCVSYDGDQMDWSPVWPDDFRVDLSKTSEPMTADW
jgi:hypothetical protein